MNQTEVSKDDFEALFANDSPVIAVISKKIRNRKKKLDKLVQKIMECHKDKSKKSDPEDDIKKEKIEAQIKELEEIRQGMKDEALKMIHNIKASSKPQVIDDKAEERIIENALGRVADALLINLLQNHHQTQTLIGDHENDGLKALLVSFHAISHPDTKNIIYDRARDCFVEVFRSFAKGSEDIIPGSNVTYRHLAEQVDSIPASVRKASHSFAKPEVVAVQQPVQVSVTQEVKKQEEVKQEAQPDVWHQQDDEDDGNEEDEENDATIEQLAAEDALKEQIPVPLTAMKNKAFIDEDGFTHVKPHARPAAEHQYLQKKFRNNRQARNKHTERWKVKEGGSDLRGGRGHRGRGGHVHHDKHDWKEGGGKNKTAHGNTHWKKGEVRVDNTKND